MSLTEKFKCDSVWPDLIMIALSTLLGIQVFKVFLSLVVNYFRERPSVSLYEVAIYVFVVFLATILSGLLLRYIRSRSIILILFGGLGIVRIILQLVYWGPFNLALSGLGVVLWISSIVFITAYIPRSSKKVNHINGFLAGFLIYLLIYGISGTLDLVWQRVPPVNVLVISIASVYLFSVFSTFIRSEKRYIYYDSLNAFSTIIILPAWLFLEIFKYLNIAALNAVTGLTYEISFLLVIVAAILAFAYISLYGKAKTRPVFGVLSAVFMIYSLLPHLSPATYIVQVILGQAGMFWMFLSIFEKNHAGSVKRTPWKTSTAFMTGGIMAAILIFIYYAAYDIRLPFENWVMVLLAGIFVAVLGMISSIYSRTTKDRPIHIKPAAFLLLLLMIPLVMMIPPRDADIAEQEKDTLKVMTYNIHQGFDIDGFLSLDEIIKTIEETAPDIIALQEVSRGWLINATNDNLHVLASRLDMDYIFMPASDDIWGNAILSKYPISKIKSGFLPREQAPLRRSYLLANIEVEGQKSINVMCVHIHHIEGEGKIREKQVEALLEEWGGLEKTLVLGDFNAISSDAEIKKMLQASFKDTARELKKEGLPTWVHYEPIRRIDYIFATPDIGLLDLDVTYSRASDHLPVTLELDP